jgi:hypothetical protein
MTDNDLTIGYRAGQEDAQSKLTAEIERLRDVVKAKELRIIELTSALIQLSSWRDVCHSYDLDTGHSPRHFSDHEEWELVEQLATRALAR